MLHAVIMAGGSGTRFWPASRASTPKQLLSLVGKATMIRQTYERLGDLVTPQQTLIVTNQRIIDAVSAQLPDLPAEAVVGEPCKRDTAPCIGLAALLVSRHDPEATMAVMPADHVIRSAEKFRAAIRQAATMVENQSEQIVTFGIRPNYAAEIFGYIQRGAAIDVPHSVAASHVVKQFREKPDMATAAQYLASGEYYWNSGIFIWKAKTIIGALAMHQPEMLTHLQKIVAAWGTDQQETVLEIEFSKIKGISIDYAVMEHAENVAVIEAPFDWDDLGSWQSLARLQGKDQHGNTLAGRHIGLNTQGTIVRSTDNHLIVTLGLEDMIVVHTPDATLVAHKNNEESIRQVVTEIENRGWIEHL